MEQPTARLAQSAERKALNLVVVGSSPTVGVHGVFYEMAWMETRKLSALASMWCRLAI